MFDKTICSVQDFFLITHCMQVMIRLASQAHILSRSVNQTKDNYHSVAYISGVHPSLVPYIPFQSAAWEGLLFRADVFEWEWTETMLLYHKSSISSDEYIDVPQKLNTYTHTCAYAYTCMCSITEAICSYSIQVFWLIEQASHPILFGWWMQM